MSIRHAILGLLAERPMHGYRIRKAFAERVSPLWGLTTGQVYQSLAALQRRGLVVARAERTGRRPTRRIYSATDTGQQELDRWQRAAPAACARPFREEILIRLMLLRREDAEPLSQAIAAQEREASLLLEHVRHARARRAPEEGIDVAATFLDGMTRHLEAEVANLQLFQRAIARWLAGGAAPAPPTAAQPSRQPAGS